MMPAVIVLAVMLATVGYAGARAVKRLQARLNALEATANAEQEWKDAVRRAIGASER